MIREVIPASTLADALKLCREGTCFLAGGTEVNRLGSPWASHAVIPLGGLLPSAITREHDVLTIGSGCTLQDMIDSRSVPQVLKDAAASARSRTLRNMATLGGNIASSRDDSYLNAVLAAYHAKLTVLLPGGITKMPIEDYLLNPAGIILDAVLDASASVAFRRHSRASQGPCALVCAVSRDPASRTWRAAVSARSSGTVRLPAVEKLLDEQGMPDAESVTAAAAAAWSPAADISGSMEYKQYLLGVCVCACAEEIRRTSS